MTQQTIRVIAYAEQCVRQGQPVPAREIQDHGEDCWDYTVHEGPAEELLAEADSLDSKYQGHYRFALARTIREAVYAERPDLRPAADEEE